MTRRSALSSLAGLAVAVAGFAFVESRPARAADAPDGKKAAATFDVYKDKAGEFRWRLRMQNTKVIATSGEGYSTKHACEEAIESVKKNAADAPIEEKSSDKSDDAGAKS